MNSRGLPLIGIILLTMSTSACLLIVPSPVMEQVPNQTVVVEEELRIDLALYASDPEDRPLTYSVTEGPGAIDDESIFVFVPSATDVGAHAIEVAATNGLREARSLFFVTVVE